MKEKIGQRKLPNFLMCQQAHDNDMIVTPKGKELSSIKLV